MKVRVAVMCLIALAALTVLMAPSEVEPARPEPSAATIVSRAFGGAA